jgi:hypothetical protein
MAHQKSKQALRVDQHVFRARPVPRPLIMNVNFWAYPEQHKLKIHSEAKWWHHAPTVPQSMPGNAYINGNHIFLPLIYGEAPDPIAAGCCGLRERLDAPIWRSRSAGSVKTFWRNRSPS